MLVEDETDVRLFPPLRAAWARRGEAARVELSGRNAKRVVFGSINIRTGKLLLLVAKSQKAEDFQRYLRFVRRTYRGWRVVMILDEDASHTARASARLARDLDFELIWLPTRCPELNPMEGLWGDAKQR